MWNATGFLGLDSFNEKLLTKGGLGVLRALGQNIKNKSFRLQIPGLPLLHAEVIIVFFFFAPAWTFLV